MASAIDLNAQATITNGQGLAVNANIAGLVTQYLNLPAVVLISNIFSMSATAAISDLTNTLETLGTIQSQGKYLLDFYPSNVTPVCSGTVTFYGNTSATASFINTYNTQASLPFSHGMSGFANVVSTCRSYSIQSFDTIGSIKMLSGKTYGQSGVGYNGLTDLATGGIGSDGATLGAAVAHFGTMFDIENINLFADPYVFGQNLLNQGFGQYGNLTVNLQAAGLDVTDITKIPSTTTTVTQEQSSYTKSTVIGEIELPVYNNVSQTTLVTGGSVDVILDIYRKVSGDDLAQIVSATGITTVGVTNTPTTLADYLDIQKVVDAGTVSKLAAIGIHSLDDLSHALNSKIGHGSFSKWSQISTLLSKIYVPTLKYTTTAANTSVLNASTASILTSASAKGSGDLGNAILNDYIGACSDPLYTQRLATLVNSYHQFNMGGVEAGLTQLKQAVIYWINHITYGTDGDGNPTVSYPSMTPISTAISSVISSLNALPANGVQAAQTAQYQLLNAMATEVTNLTSAAVVFKADPTPTTTLNSFAQSIGSLLQDKDQTNSYKTILDLTTNDAAGDTIRALAAEITNAELLSSAGIAFDNNPNPTLATQQARTQNVPLTTYLSQNK